MAKVIACGSHVQNFCKVSTGLGRKAAAVDPWLTNVSAKKQVGNSSMMARSSHHYYAAAYYEDSAIRLLLELVKDEAGKMKDHQECVETSFMDKLQAHSYPYMRTIRRGCSEALQKPGPPMLGECQMMLNILIAKVQGQSGTRGSVFDKCDLKWNYLHANNGLST
jgi:hypothetical protein